MVLSKARQRLFVVITLVSAAVLLSSFHHAGYTKHITSLISDTFRSPGPAAIAFCPAAASLADYVPTVILQGTAAFEEDKANRTHWMPRPFLPFSDPMHFAQNFSRDPSHPAALPSSPIYPSGVPLTGDDDFDTPWLPDLADPYTRCSLFPDVPSAPRLALPPAWSHSNIMFGMSTTADRIVYHLPVWEHFLPRAPADARPLDLANPLTTRDLPEVYISMEPTDDSKALADISEAQDKALDVGIHVRVNFRDADRYQVRYFSLLQTMWQEAQRREARDGAITEWFCIADDDTFVPEFRALVRMLASYDSSGDWLIGDLSESPAAVGSWGHMAYGGGGIFLSRGLMSRINSPGQFEQCHEKYSKLFGGDQMISLCAALSLSTDIPSMLRVEDTLHQLDLRGDASGYFQAGFVFTTIHHWGSWCVVLPPWHKSFSETRDARRSVLLVGEAAEALGADNWGRRYVFDEGRVVVSLGYSVVIYANATTPDELAKSEITWSYHELWNPCRPGLTEGPDKTSYILSSVRELSPGVHVFEHRSPDDERVDVVYDGRADRAATRWRAWEHAPTLPNKGHH